jgi:asparagine N-glycosylation enzyme membrane subunit Stt3
MDWLSYACVVFAVFLLGAIKNPVRNVWIVQAFMIACILAIMLPFLAGPIRDTPIFWRFIDSSFGIVGFLFLLLPYRLIKKLETLINQKSTTEQR